MPPKRPHAALISDYNDYFAGLPGVVSVGLGQDAEGAPALNVLVDPLTYDPRLIPPVFNGYPVRVIFSPPALLTHAPHKDRRRPLRAGISVIPALFAPLGFTAGTIGALLTRQGRTWLVSNNHVLCNNDPGSLGQLVHQPAWIDGGGQATDVIGRVFHFDPLEFGLVHNRLDIAVAEITLPEPVNPIPEDFTLQPLESFRVPNIGETVRKSGRTTGLTTGQVVFTDTLVNVHFDPPIGTLVFTGCVGVRGSPFMMGGDSGSWAYDDQLNMVGLCFAGNCPQAPCPNPQFGFMINPLDVAAYLNAVIGPPPVALFVNLGEDQVIQLDGAGRGILALDYATNATGLKTWARLAGPPVVQVADTGPSEALLEFTGAGEFTLRLTIQPSTGQPVSDTVNVRALAPGEPPPPPPGPKKDNTRLLLGVGALAGAALLGMVSANSSQRF